MVSELVLTIVLIVLFNTVVNRIYIFVVSCIVRLKIVIGNLKIPGKILCFCKKKLYN